MSRLGEGFIRWQVRMLVQIALDAHGGQFPCFSGGADAVLNGLEQRFRPDLTSKRVRQNLALFWFGVCVPHN